MHIFAVKETKFDISFDEQFKAIKLVTKKELRLRDSVDTGIIALSNKNYIFMQPISNIGIIHSPIDSGYLGKLALIASRPVTLPKGYTFYLMELKDSDVETVLPDEVKLRKPAYKGDIGRDTYLSATAEDKKDIQFMFANNPGQLFLPRSSAARKGFEVHVNDQFTVIRRSDLRLLKLSEALSVLQVVKANISKFDEKVKFLDPEDAQEMLTELMNKSARGTRKEGSSDVK